MAKLRITALDGLHQGEVVEAQFNPKEISVDRAVAWQEQPHGGPAALQFERVDPARMSFELLFDGVEAAASVQPYLDQLARLTRVDDDLHRPPKVKVVWGRGASALPTFAGVIESVSVRYTMFAESGVPLRATAAVQLREAVAIKVDASDA